LPSPLCMIFCQCLRLIPVHHGQAESGYVADPDRHPL